MDLISIFLIAIGLSFDSFAVSVSSGLILRKIVFRDAVKIAFSLAFFQGMMPLAGWLIGLSIKEYVRETDHWIAFGLLTLLGAKMIYESIGSKEKQSSFNPMKIWVLIGISLATSIDALVVGVTFGFIEVKIISSVLIIGSVTFIISMLGILAGKTTSSKLGKKMEILGGIILIGIGVKILISHLYF